MTGAVTISVALDVRPSTTALIETVPTARPVTTPRFDTVAIDWLELDHVTVRPVSGLPAASVATAFAWVVSPAIIMLLPSTTLKFAIVAPPTFSSAAPVTPSTVAVIFAMPVDRPVTTPDGDTVATAGFALDQVTARSVIALPLESYAVAAACVVCPTWMVDAFIATATLKITAGFASTVVCAFLSPAVAVMVAEPTLRAESTPDDDTMATELSELPHTTIQSLIGLPVESCAAACICNVLPTFTFAEGAGVTTTLATGTGLTRRKLRAILPLRVTVTVVTPRLIAVTLPASDTVTIVGSFETHLPEEL